MHQPNSNDFDPDDPNSNDFDPDDPERNDFDPEDPERNDFDPDDPNSNDFDPEDPERNDFNADDPNSNDFDPEDPERIDFDLDDAGDALDDATDALILELLACGFAKLRQWGLILLDAKKRKKMCGLLRRHGRSWQLSGPDIAQIWRATMDSIWKNATNRRIGTVGNLDGYVRTILFRRASDFSHERIWFAPDVDLQNIKNYRCDNKHEPPDPQLIKLIRAAFKRLAKNEKRVITHDLRWYFNSKSNKWPSLKELAASVNEDGGDVLSLNSVKSARTRARNKLHNDGYEKED